jgi:CheY-like chemotaxis protein
MDLNAEIVRTVKMLERTIPKMISIDMHLASDLAIINGDANQLEQVLMNLGANARDAMPGGGNLIIETSNVHWNDDDCQDGSKSVPGRYARLTVTDTGEGMDAETINHIFEPFFTTKGAGEGTGLGLSTVHGIVKSHGGYIECHSQPGQGASFEIYLPESKADESTLADTIKCGVDVRGGDETILVVDDEKALLEISEDILREYGYNVITADSGEKLLDIYRRAGPSIDLIILDLGMPGMGGRDCLDELLKIDPLAKVLIASGYSAEDQVKQCLAKGAGGFISKPYRLNDMLIKIRQTLDLQLKLTM